MGGRGGNGLAGYKHRIVIGDIEELNGVPVEDGPCTTREECLAQLPMPAEALNLPSWQQSYDPEYAPWNQPESQWVIGFEDKNLESDAVNKLDHHFAIFNQQQALQHRVFSYKVQV